MNFKSVIMIIMIAVLGNLFPGMAQDILVFKQSNYQGAIPISCIDSITVSESFNYNVYLSQSVTPLTITADTVFYNQSVPDTLILEYSDACVYVWNPRMDLIDVEVNNTDVEVKATDSKPLVCLVRGSCCDGRLIVDCDKESVIVLDGLMLDSQKGSVFYFKQNQPVRIVLNSGKVNTLADAGEYLIIDESDKSNACIYSKGSISFEGDGILNVQGNYKHSIASSKNVTVEGGVINIAGTQKDGIHCDKYRQKGGLLNMSLPHPATKGIKSKELFELRGGAIHGMATGDLLIADGETTYCTLIKSDSSCVVRGGEIVLSHTGEGGRCISADVDLLMTGGKLDLQCHGNGGAYLTALNDSDYYTPKCITVNGRTIIQRGQVNLLSTGIGGKGLDCSDTIFVGINGDDFIGEDSLLINIETRGSAIVENVNEDYLHGCPKAIKADNDIELYSGNLRIKTFGSGGEGIESKGSLRAYNATIIADCYDDGINTGQRCYIKGAHIYCRSLNNDGIDSNGKLSVTDGIVAAISEHFMNESFDTEGGRLHIYGGQVIGIGCNEVYVSEQSTVPYYSTRLHYGQWGERYGDSLAISENKYLTISKSDKAIISLFHENAFSDAFIIVASSIMEQGEIYQISDDEMPVNPLNELFDERVIVGGTINNLESLYNFYPY